MKGRRRELHDLLVERVGEGDLSEMLAEYGALLERWSRRHSLVSFRSRKELVDRHLTESLVALSMVRRCQGTLLDIGSGAGLPGIPLLLATGRKGVLLEPRAKRWSFLKQAVRLLDLDCEVLRMRFEELGEEYRDLGVITVRSVGRHREIAQWAESRLDQEGVLLVWTNEEHRALFEDLGRWRMLSSPLPGSEGGRLIQLRPCFT